MSVEREMHDFWNAKAKEHAPFYIATWRGYERRDTERFFLSGDEAAAFVRDSGYQPNGQDRMVEIGCGIGRMTHGFAQLFGEVHAIDVSEEMIRQAKDNLIHLNNVSLYNTSGSDLAPFADASIDFCFSYIVFQHIPSKDIIFNYFAEAGRVLRPGGVFHVQVKGLPDPDVGTQPGILAVKRAYRHYIRRPGLTLWRRLRGGPNGFESPAWIGVSLTPTEITASCKGAGLSVQKITGEGTQYMWVTAVRSTRRDED
jgi:SAM-dependent methyltransferase